MQGFKQKKKRKEEDGKCGEVVIGNETSLGIRLSVSRSIRLLDGRSVSPSVIISIWAGSFTSMLLSEHLLFL